MRIAIVQNRSFDGIVSAFGQRSPEVYSAKTLVSTSEGLRDGGHTVFTSEGDKHQLAELERTLPPGPGGPGGLVFNMSYGIQGQCRYTHVPSMLEMAGIPYTGSGPLGHTLALDKVITKTLLRAAGVPTPGDCVMRTGRDPVPDALRFPVVVKPRHESTSFGLRLVHSRDDLAEAVDIVASKYDQDALVEEYIDGQEVCAGLLGNGHMLEVLPLVEQDFGDRAVRMVTWEDKFHKTTLPAGKICPARLERGLADEIRAIAVATFDACHCRDYARVDLRIDRDGRPWVLEINSMASLGRDGSYVHAAAAAGYSHAALVNRIVDVAHRRYFGSAAPRYDIADTPPAGAPAV